MTHIIYNIFNHQTHVENGKYVRVYASMEANIGSYTYTYLCTYTCVYLCVCVCMCTMWNSITKERETRYVHG